MLYDVIISGAGPGGSTAAKKLAQKGFSVLILDKSSFPRDKLCGGGLTPPVYEFLDTDISSVLLKRCKTVRCDFNYKKGNIFRLNSNYIDQVLRRDFDKLLLDKAIEEGVHFQARTKTIDFEEHDDGVTVLTNKGNFKGKCLIGADGALSPIARKFGFSNKDSFFILEALVPYAAKANPEEKDTLVLDTGIIKHGYAWIFPKGDFASVGIGSSKIDGKTQRKILEEYFQKYKHLFDLSNIKVKGFSGPEFSSWKTKRASNKTLLIGDSARLMNPLSGEGIHNAIWSGALAADYLGEHLHKDNTAIDCHSFHETLKWHIGPEVEKYLKVKRFFCAWPYFWYNLMLKSNILRARKYLQPTRI